MSKLLFISGQMLGRVVLFFVVLMCLFGFLLSTLWKIAICSKNEQVSWSYVWSEVCTVISSLKCLVSCDLESEKSLEERKIKPRGQK